MSDQTDEPDYLRLNRANWDDRAVLHAEHGGYDLRVPVEDPTHLSDVVTFDRPRLGDLTGVRGVHLQCHLGTDTLVYTGIGALCWLPSIDRWAGVVADLLVPGGRLFLREGHPMTWALDDPRPDGVLALEFPYFELPEPNEWDENVTYVDVGERRLTHTRTQEWNHGLAETITALMRHGMALTAIEEHDSAPWAFLGDQTVPHPDHPSEFRLRDRPWRVAATYTLQAVKAGPAVSGP